MSESTEVTFLIGKAETGDVSAQDFYNASMDWCDELENMMYDVPMDANGKFLLQPGVYSDIIYRLLSDWKLKWWDGDKTVIITGTMITDDNSSRTVPPDSGSIETIFQVNTSGTIEQTDISINTFIDDSSPAADEFDGDSASLSSSDDFYNGCVIVFTGGDLQGIARKVSDYVGATRTFKFNGSTNAADAPFPDVPADADKFRIIGRIA